MTSLFSSTNKNENENNNNRQLSTTFEHRKLEQMKIHPSRFGNYVDVLSVIPKNKLLLQIGNLRDMTNQECFKIYDKMSESIRSLKEIITKCLDTLKESFDDYESFRYDINNTNIKLECEKYEKLLEKIDNIESCKYNDNNDSSHKNFNLRKDIPIWKVARMIICKNLYKKDKEGKLKRRVEDYSRTVQRLKMWLRSIAKKKTFTHIVDYLSSKDSIKLPFGNTRLKLTLRSRSALIYLKTNFEKRDREGNHDYMACVMIMTSRLVIDDEPELYSKFVLMKNKFSSRGRNPISLKSEDKNYRSIMFNLIKIFGEAVSLTEGSMEMQCIEVVSVGSVLIKHTVHDDYKKPNEAVIIQDCEDAASEYKLHYERGLKTKRDKERSKMLSVKARITKREQNQYLYSRADLLKIATEENRRVTLENGQLAEVHIAVDVNKIEPPMESDLDPEYDMTDTEILSRKMKRYRLKRSNIYGNDETPVASSFYDKSESVPNFRVYQTSNIIKSDATMEKHLYHLGNLLKAKVKNYEKTREDLRLLREVNKEHVKGLIRKDLNEVGNELYEKMRKHFYTNYEAMINAMGIDTLLFYTRNRTSDQDPYLLRKIADEEILPEIMTYKEKIIKLCEEARNSWDKLKIKNKSDLLKHCEKTIQVKRSKHFIDPLDLMNLILGEIPEELKKSDIVAEKEKEEEEKEGRLIAKRDIEKKSIVRMVQEIKGVRQIVKSNEQKEMEKWQKMIEKENGAIEMIKRLATGSEWILKFPKLKRKMRGLHAYELLYSQKRIKTIVVKADNRSLSKEQKENEKMIMRSKLVDCLVNINMKNKNTFI